jgi:hypothetical protein
MRRWLPVLVMLVVLPGVLHACPVCFDQREQNRLAFFTTTIFLSLLPLGMVLGVYLWLKRRMAENVPTTDS